MQRVGICTAVLVLCLAAGCGREHSGLYVDNAIESEIRQIPSIDNHAHPAKVVAYGEEDRDYDALLVNSIEDLAMPTPLRGDTPYLPQAWHGLWGYQYSDFDVQHLAKLDETRRDVVKQKGDLYPSWVLNQTNTEIMLANRVAMGRGLSNDRFKWVPFVDMFLFPLNNHAIKAQDPDHNAFLGREESLLAGYLAEGQVRKLPPAFDDYLNFVSHSLATWKANGAVAVKFELAYLRDLAISNPQRENADRVYSIYAQSSEPSPEEYKILQDFLFRYIAQEAGQLKMAVHIHTSIGAGSYFRDANADPLALEPLFNDPTLRRTKFVMLHGSWPFAREAAALILKPNVYLDYSALAYLTYPAEAARALRLYLEAAPEKVMYASDASPLSNRAGWEETDWIGSRNGRLSLGVALTGMVEDGEVTLDRAKQIAHMVIRDNARQLYGF